MRQALLVIDMLNDFVREGATLEVPRTRDILPALKTRIEGARREGIPVIYICDAHAPNDREFSVWPPHAVRGTEGAQVVAELSPEKDEFVLQKTTLLGFYETGLGGTLESLGVEELIVTGCVTNICVYYIALEAVVRGYRVRVPVDSVAALNEADGEFALRQMESILGVLIER